ncbi:HTH-type transcriptional regulator KipR [Sporosarcina sp. NCCP-2716]|uniref:IclR family transcriptional regulator n=1 Tax=Sporosarcina sp. NCCP-2716 TaxID=2943679 RepID=UPI00203B7DA2|nr:IclR family transcriptional regulator [Sporosarcina sp. NCCP-2716]GKV70494.1 HTH-type transcriptional regulator KipR [Sporosarcina sp. NCCP-2716]
MSAKNKTVVRSLDILNLFVEHPALTFQEIIELSGVPKSSVYRMLTSLEEMKFLEKGADTRYRLGLLFLQYGSLVSKRLDLRQVAYPIMERLHAETKEAINLIVRQDDEAIYVEKIDRFQKVRLYTAIGRSSPLYAGACSRVILSHLSDAFITEYFEREEFQQYANGTMTDPALLWKTIQETRETGYTLSHSELENHTSALAAPIFNFNGDILAGISIAGIEANYQPEQVELLIPKVKGAALEISRQLGYME